MLKVLFCVTGAKLAINWAYNKLVFQPHKCSSKEFKDLLNEPNLEPCQIQIGVDKSKSIFGALYNRYRKPSWNDTIFLYSHGNAGWVGDAIHSSTISMLSKFGSIFLYDYQGYGASPGTPSEWNLYQDCWDAWRFIRNEKNVPRDKIVLYGHSLGCGPTLRLFDDLTNPKLPNGKISLDEPPKAVILEAPFFNINERASELVSFASCLVPWEFQNDFHMENIPQTCKCKVFIFHSKSDEVIPFNHGKRLAKKRRRNGKFIEIKGSHNDPIFTNEALDVVKGIVNQPQPHA